MATATSERTMSLPGVSSTGDTRDFDSPMAARDIRLILRESRTNNAYDPDKFRSNMRGLMGLEEVGKVNGFPKYRFNKAKQKIGYDSLPLRETSRELLGSDFVSGLGNGKTADHHMIKLREALAPVTSSSQQDINAYSIYIGGLVELSFHQGYDLPAFIGEQIIEEVPTNVRQQRIIGEANLNLPDRQTLEGNEYPNQGVQPRWVIRPPVIKYGQKASLTREAVVFGLGGELLKAIEGGGKSLAYLKDYLTAAYVQGQNIPAGTPGFMDGQAVNTFIYNQEPNATSQPLFQTAAQTGTNAVYNYVNQFAATPLVNWQTLALIRGYLALMREPETNFPVLTDFSDIIVAPAAHDNAEVIVHSKQVFPFSPGTSTSAVLGGGTYSDNPAGNAGIRLWSSPIWNKQLVDAGISQANANIYWYAGNVRKAVKWASVWPTRIIQANNLSSELVGSDIVGEWVYSWFGTPFIMDPHFLLLMTN